MSNDNPLKHIFGIELNTGKKAFFLDNNAYTIGRGSGNNITINNQVISRHHATLLKVIYENKQDNSQEIKFWIIDGDLKGNKSTNGIFVNGQKCSIHQLNAGDIIILGGIEVKAKYDLVNLNSKTFYSLQAQENLEESSSEEKNHSEEMSTIAVCNTKYDTEPITKYLSEQIHQLNQLYSYPFFTLNYKGEIINISNRMKEEFTDVEIEQLKNSLLTDIEIDVSSGKSNFSVQDITLDDKKVIVYLYHSDNSDNREKITVYVINPQNQEFLQDQIYSQEQEYQNIIEQTSEGLIFIDINTKKILDTNSAYCQMLGYENKQELLNFTLNDLLISDHDILDANINKIIHNSVTFTRESVNLTKNKSTIAVQMRGQLSQYLGQKVISLCIKNISEQKKLEELLLYQTYHDVATHLPNYKLFREQLSSTLENQKTEFDSSVALILIKINEWRSIGYEYSYSVSETLLKKLAKKLKKCLSSRDLIYRWRDDEFAIIVSQKESSTVEKIEQKILQIPQTNISIDNQEIKFSFSLAIVYSPQQGNNDEVLLQNADKILAQKYYEYSSGERLP